MSEPEAKPTTEPARPPSAPVITPAMTLHQQVSETSPQAPVAAQSVPVRPFAFDGGAGTFLGTALAGFFVTVLTLGICLPWAIVMRYRWQTKHTYVNGHRLAFTGSAIALFGNWIKWWLLSVVTVGIYLLWVIPRLTKWIVEHQEFDPTYHR